MNDPTNSWEDDWRDELAGYEAPQKAADWAGMEALLTGGVAAPPEPVPPGPAATGYAVWWKGVVFTLALMAAGGIGYFLNEKIQAEQITAESNLITDTLPNGFRYEVRTYRKKDRNGKVISTRQDSTIVPVRYRMDTSYQSLADGSLKRQMDSMEIRPQQSGRSTTSPLSPGKISPAAIPLRFRFDPLYKLDRLGTPVGIESIDTVDLRQQKRLRPRSGGTTLNDVPELNLPAFSTNFAPAAAPRKRAVSPIRNSVPHDLPDNAALLRQRLLRIVKEHPLAITPAGQNNGYFPPVRNER